MRNPLWRRIPKELKGELGKYMVIFLFMVITTGMVSGFMVAGESMKKTTIHLTNTTWRMDILICRMRRLTI